MKKVRKLIWGQIRSSADFPTDCNAIAKKKEKGVYPLDKNDTSKTA